MYTSTPMYDTDTVSDSDIINNLNEELEQAHEENKQLKYTLGIRAVSCKSFTNDDTCISCYTGFGSCVSFLTFCTVIQPPAKHMTNAYYVPIETVSLAGRKRSMQLIDELFLCFVDYMQAC